MTKCIAQSLPPTLIAAVVCLGTFLALLTPCPVQAELQGRELDGNVVNGPEAYYDTDLNVTWLREASTSAYDWQRANLWAGQDRFGVTGWRLPTMVDKGRDGCPPPGATPFSFSLAGPTDCGYNSTRVDEVGYVSELAQLFYVTLKNKAYYAPGTGDAGQPNWGLAHTDGFLNLQPNYYWFGSTYVSANSGYHWRFDMLDGLQFFGTDSELGFALAVRSGDVASVPEPDSGWLFLIGGTAILLWTLRLRRRRASVRIRAAVC